MKKILGLDLGTNSIGWAVVCHSDTDGQTERKWIEMAGRDRKSTRLNSSHTDSSRMPSSA